MISMTLFPAKTIYAHTAYLKNYNLINKFIINLTLFINEVVLLRFGSAALATVISAQRMYVRGGGPGS